MLWRVQQAEEEEGQEAEMGTEYLLKLSTVKGMFTGVSGNVVLDFGAEDGSRWAIPIDADSQISPGEENEIAIQRREEFGDATQLTIPEVKGRWFPEKIGLMRYAQSLQKTFLA